ncbi:hypothetical protein CCH79_00001532 [Gambusia affinis]|uniref:Uncharacterized protein n=1 Tax=Gambusia affinis TaxID=33528 RepID=A0A315VRS3_GAMAF|nr:hypothetical protein CCH79_00001532 [Gambusia affinis]
MLSWSPSPVQTQSAARDCLSDHEIGHRHHSDAKRKVCQCGKQGPSLRGYARMVRRAAMVKLDVHRRAVRASVQTNEAVRLGCCPRTMRSLWRAITATVSRDMMINPELVRWKAKQKLFDTPSAPPASRKSTSANMGAVTQQMNRSQKDRLRIIKSKLVRNLRKAGSKKDRNTTRLPYEPIKKMKMRSREQKVKVAVWITAQPEGGHSDPSTAGASKLEHHKDWREYKRSNPERPHGGAQGLQRRTEMDRTLLILQEFYHQDPHVFHCFLVTHECEQVVKNHDLELSIGAGRGLCHMTSCSTAQLMSLYSPGIDKRAPLSIDRRFHEHLEQPMKLAPSSDSSSDGTDSLGNGLPVVISSFATAQHSSGI